MRPHVPLEKCGSQALIVQKCNQKCNSNKKVRFYHSGAWQSPVHDENGLVDAMGDWQPIENILEHAKYLRVVLVQNLVLKPINAVDFFRLVVAPGQKEIV